MNSTDTSVRGANLDGLMRSVKAGRIAHAFLFSGPRGTGKKTGARYVAQSILCKSQDAPCGVCPICKQMQANTHPDIHTISTDARSISVDDIRELRSKLSLRPFEGDRHIVFIYQAEKMTTQAQNALLKTLEEPSGDTVFFLITDQPGSMLFTIVSRCRVVRFSPLSINACIEVLRDRGIDIERAKLLAGCAQGCVGRALEIDGIKGYFELRDQIFFSLACLGSGRSKAAEAVAAVGGLKESSANALEIIEVIARDQMALQNGGRAFSDMRNMNIDGRALLLGVMNIRRMLASNVPWANAVERAYLDLLN